jgi:hypothetical protein
MAAQRHLAETAYDLDQPQVQPGERAPFLANAGAEPRPSPARLLQDELRRAFSPGPIVAERFSARRALKFIAPTWLGMWAFIAMVGHIGHH